ncbi:MAG: alpha/beta hydrolase [Rhodospirillaceae bacterium]
MALYAAIPYCITVVLNITAWLSGADLMDPRNPAVAGLSIVSAIVFLPFTVTWYRAIILGDDDLRTRPLFRLGGLEGKMLVWQLIIGLIVIGIGLLGALLISGVLRALSTVLGPTTELLSAASLGIWGVFVISVLCRLSLVLAMAATGRPAIISEAWKKSHGLGSRMAAIFILCIMSVVALIIPAQFVVLTAASIVGLLSDSMADSVSMLLQILLGTIGSLLVYVIPATFFAFVYMRIASSMTASKSPLESKSLNRTDTQTVTTINANVGGDKHEHTESQVKAILQHLGEYLASKPKETPQAMRDLIDGLFANKTLPPSITIEDVDMGGLRGCFVTSIDANTNRVVLLLHGGGFVSGSIASHRHLAAEVSAFCGTRVLLVEYRLAPEHPYPDGLNDCVRAYQWLLKKGIKPGHIAILGDSAGGGLVISTALRLKESGIDQPSALIALSPWVNLKCDGETMDTKANDDPITNRESLSNVASLYLNGANPKDPLISPIYGDLRGLPPLLIQVGTREVLLDDSRKLAARAKADEMTVALEEWPGMFHVWHMWSDSLTDARQALGGVSAFIRRQMG